MKHEGVFEEECYDLRGYAIWRLVRTEPDGLSWKMVVPDVRTILRERRGLQERIQFTADYETLRFVLLALVEKLDAMEKPVNACLAMSAIHGSPYTGPNWGVELAAIKAALKHDSSVP
jgi:hypothetical protein